VELCAIFWVYDCGPLEDKELVFFLLGLFPFGHLQLGRLLPSSEVGFQHRIKFWKVCYTITLFQVLLGKIMKSPIHHVQ
jgi:hypothetical protein